MNGAQLAPLYTLQYCLPRDAESFGGVLHGKPSEWCVFYELRAQFFGQPDAPRGTWSELLAGDKAVEQPPQQRRLGNAQDLCGASDRHDLTGWRLSWRLVTGDVAVPSEATDQVGGEALPGGTATTLTIENARDDRVRIVLG